MKIPIQPRSTDETNALLRALWASMRAEFGDIPWQFSPMRRGERNTIYFGWANLGLKQPVRIGVSYKRKGIATGLLFENVDEVATRIKQCVETALVSEPAETTFFVTVGMSPKIHMASATGKLIQIKPLDKGTFRLGLRVKGFDTIDTTAELERRTRLIADALSFITNARFRLLRKQEDNVRMDKAYTEINSTPSDDWLDGHPISNDQLVIDEQSLAFLDALLADKLGEQVAILADAAHHFHSGLNAELQESELETVGANIEQAMIFYLSSLEVASLIGAPDPSTCESCGQAQYRISTRVVDFVRVILGDTASDLVKSLYGLRSNYLHRGLLLSTRAYTRVAIPQLDPLSSHGVQPQLAIEPVLNLREFTSFCLRRVAKECLHSEII
jgi:hypothetical protein